MSPALSAIRASASATLLKLPMSTASCAICVDIFAAASLLPVIGASSACIVPANSRIWNSERPISDAETRAHLRISGVILPKLVCTTFMFSSMSDATLMNFAPIRAIPPKATPATVATFVAVSATPCSLVCAPLRSLTNSAVSARSLTARVPRTVPAINLQTSRTEAAQSSHP